jgi:hypothetical protein
LHRGPTVTVTVAVSAWPLLSVDVYVNVVVPENPAVGVNTTCPAVQSYGAARAGLGHGGH